MKEFTTLKITSAVSFGPDKEHRSKNIVLSSGKTGSIGLLTVYKSGRITCGCGWYATSKSRNCQHITDYRKTVKPVVEQKPRDPKARKVRRVEIDGSYGSGKSTGIGQVTIWSDGSRTCDCKHFANSKTSSCYHTVLAGRTTTAKQSDDETSDVPNVPETSSNASETNVVDTVKVEGQTETNDAPVVA